MPRLHALSRAPELARPLLDLCGSPLEAALHVASGAVAAELSGEALTEARAYLSRCAGRPAPVVDAQPYDEPALDALLEASWRLMPEEKRVASGSVYTPRLVATFTLQSIGYGRGDARLLDPACGGGIFLLAAARMLRARARREGRGGRDTALLVLESIHGLDLDADACAMARTLVGLEALLSLGKRTAGDVRSLPLPRIGQADALEPGTGDDAARQIKESKFAWVVGNPPYLEAKKMPAAARDACRRRFGAQLFGAFDLYMCFLLAGLEWLEKDGALGFVLPNKFLVAKYAGPLRARLLAERRLHTLVDLSELPVFEKVGVYPVIVGVKRARQCQTLHRVEALEALEAKPAFKPLKHSLLRSFAEPPVFFTLPDDDVGRLLERALTLPERLGEHVELRSTCSFHAKGLRERYVFEECVDGRLPYLGGQSYARENEVRPFGNRWRGFGIRYAESELAELGNPLPPRSLFQRPKVVFCQHARTLVAWFDADGRFVTKDVFPIAFPKSGDPRDAAYLAGLFNSRVYSALYALLYRGIQIGGGYLHFLPSWLANLPYVAPPEIVRDAVAERVQRIQAGDADAAKLYEDVDAYVSALFGIEGRAHEALRRFADETLGFAPDALARS